MEDLPFETIIKTIRDEPLNVSIEFLLLNLKPLLDNIEFVNALSDAYYIQRPISYKDQMLKSNTNIIASLRESFEKKDPHLLRQFLISVPSNRDLTAAIIGAIDNDYLEGVEIMLKYGVNIHYYCNGYLCTILWN